MNDYYIKFAILNAPYPVMSVTYLSENITRTSNSQFFEKNQTIFTYPMTLVATDVFGNEITIENITEPTPVENYEQEFEVNFPL